MNNKLKDIFKLNLDTKGGVKQFNNIINKYIISKKEKKELFKQIKNKKDNNSIEIKFYKLKLSLDIFPRIVNILSLFNNNCILYNNNVSIYYPPISLYHFTEGGSSADKYYRFDADYTISTIKDILNNPSTLNNINDKFYNGEIYLGIFATSFESIEKTYASGDIEIYKTEVNLDEIATPITKQEFLDKLYDAKKYTLEDL